MNANEAVQQCNYIGLDSLNLLHGLMRDALSDPCMCVRATEK